MQSCNATLVDLVLPVYNEAHVIEGAVAQIAEGMAAHDDIAWRIVIVNNGSTDDTRGVAERLQRRCDYVRLVHLDAKGRGRALRTAWAETDAPFSIYMDVDLSTELAAVPKVVQLLRDGADLVTGSRLHSDRTDRRAVQRNRANPQRSSHTVGTIATRVSGSSIHAIGTIRMSRPACSASTSSSVSKNHF